MTQKGFIQFKALLGLSLGFVAVSLWVYEAATVTPETAWERVFNSFLGNLPTLITAAVAAIVALRASRIAMKTSEKVDKNTDVTLATKETADGLTKKTQEIHEATNGHLSILSEQLRVAADKIEKQDRTISALLARMEVRAPVTVDEAGIVKETNP